MNQHRRFNGALCCLWVGLLATAGTLHPAEAQTTATVLDLGALLPEERFGFLEGSWSYAFPNGGGQASYEVVLEGAAVRETLDGVFNGREFAGASMFYWNGGDGRWEHRWIDTFDSVILSNPEMVSYEASDLPAMMSTFEVDGVWFKHVWYDMTPTRFETDLLVSRDGGDTYRLARRAPYLRVFDGDGR